VSDVVFLPPGAVDLDDLIDWTQVQPLIGWLSRSTVDRLEK
jgi:hypothetical protein